MTRPVNSKINQEDNMTAAAAPVSAAVAVAAQVTLEVVRGEEIMPLDAAINRLGEIQDAERALANEKQPLRDAAEFALRKAGIVSYETPQGRSVTTYSQVRGEVDWEFLATVLSPEQLARAKRTKVVTGLRVR